MIDRLAVHSGRADPWDECEIFSIFGRLLRLRCVRVLADQTPFGIGPRKARSFAEKTLRSPKRFQSDGVGKYTGASTMAE